MVDDFVVKNLALLVEVCEEAASLSGASDGYWEPELLAQFNEEEEEEERQSKVEIIRRILAGDSVKFRLKHRG